MSGIDMVQLPARVFCVLRPVEASRMGCNDALKTC
jgi:hypothetical protein